MRILRRFLTAIFFIIVALVVIAYLLPRDVLVERSITIDAPAEAIFPYVNSLQANEAWSPWLHRDPDVRLAYSGPESGVGNSMTWASDHPQVGNGTNTITVSTPNERIETALDFGDMGTADAWFAFDTQDGGTLVKWGFTTDVGSNPINRWMGLMIDRWVGGDYQDGLTRLKALVEG